MELPIQNVNQRKELEKIVAIEVVQKIFKFSKGLFINGTGGKKIFGRDST